MKGLHEYEFGEFVCDTHESTARILDAFPGHSFNVNCLVTIETPDGTDFIERTVQPFAGSSLKKWTYTNKYVVVIGEDDHGLLLARSCDAKNLTIWRVTEH
ncbi:MAG: hypothetical protein CMK32_08270 [Porticoccaceae bacterium]|nr:hypothetical protein [Porticoccaceae bacterium]